MKLVNNSNNKHKIVNFNRIYHHYIEIVFLCNWLRFKQNFLKNYSKF